MPTPTPPPLPPVMTPPSASPPVLEQPRRPNTLRSAVAGMLGCYLAVFALDAALSVASDLLILFFNSASLLSASGLFGFLTLLASGVVYLLMGVTPWIPKRVFMPVVLYVPVVLLAFLPVVIYAFDAVHWYAISVAVGQLLLLLGVVVWMRRAGSAKWLLLPPERLSGPGFTWRNLLGFAAVNVFLIIPAVLACLALCASLAVSHFSDGFIQLRTAGVAVQVRDFVRDDGKRIRLVPMAHVGDAEFYRSLSGSFPSNSTILLEGVSDKRNLLTNKVSYQRMASSMGLAEQQVEFKPQQGKVVSADVDVAQFGTNTLNMLNAVMLIHRHGLNLHTLLKLLEYSPAPGAETEIWEDLIHKRNRRLLEEVQRQLGDSDFLIIPWGAAHIPEVAREIQKSGFKHGETREKLVIRFGSARGPSKKTVEAHGPAESR